MTKMRSNIRNAAIIVLALLLFGPPRSGVAQQDTLQTAKALYASAAYEEALTLLEKLKPAATATADARGIAQYRAFCLLALDRKVEAERAIEEIVAADPFFLPDASTTSPRVLTAFHLVRRRALGPVVQEKYAAAKTSFDNKDFKAAAEELDAVVRLLNDPDLEMTPTLSDLKLLASGFLELARAAAEPPPEPEPEPVKAPPPPAEPSFYHAGDTRVTPPVARRQDVPPWPTRELGPVGIVGRKGVLEVLIDETGRVTSAVVRQSIDRRFDEILVAAALNWEYRPAMLDGRPVRYVKRIQVVAQ